MKKIIILDGQAEKELVIDEYTSQDEILAFVSENKITASSNGTIQAWEYKAYALTDLTNVFFLTADDKSELLDAKLIVRNVKNRKYFLLQKSWKLINYELPAEKN